MHLILKAIPGILIFCLAVSLLPSSAIAESINWIYTFEEALTEAEEKNSPIMVDFYSDWCGWCTKLDKETYQDEKVIQLSKRFVCLKLKTDKYPAIAKKYNIRALPTILFTDAEGKVVAGGPGFRNADRLLSEMRSVLSRSAE